VGYAQVAAETMVRLGGGGDGAARPRGAVILDARCGDLAQAKELAARAFDLAAIAEGYRGLGELLRPVLAAAPPRAGEAADALAARILLVHELRRVVLRDPGLPAALLPAPWIGEEVRRLTAACYRRLLPASERWLDERAKGEDGPLPPADGELARRFAI
jgi:phenylacetic acid degradation operon negative regulatory protein